MKSQFFLLFIAFNFLSIQAQEALFNGTNLDGWTVHGTSYGMLKTAYWCAKVDPTKPMAIYLQTNITMISN